MTQPERPDADHVSLHLENLELRTPFTLDVVRFYIGDSLVRNMVQTDAAITAHMFHTGEMAADAMRENGVGSRALEIGALAGGTHDIMKLFRRDIRERVNSDRTFTYAERAWVSEEHAADGERALKRLAAEQSYLPGAYFALRLAGFVSGRHHSILPHPHVYAHPETDPAVGLGYGLTDIIKVVDPLQALGFDATRTYVKKREGTLTPARIHSIIAQERGRPLTIYPIVDGREVDVQSYVSAMLGAEPAGARTR
jgi:hypothetical protein